MSLIYGIISSLVAQAILKAPRLFGIGRPYVDLDIPPTEMPLNETQVSLRSHPYADFTIRGRVHELKQNMALPLSLPKHTIQLIIAGWGVVPGDDRLHGAITDSGIIGEVVFSYSDGKQLRRNDVRLPVGAEPEDLKLADADPIISGAPPASLVERAGFLGVVRVDYDPAGRTFWDHANVWVSVLDVPSRSNKITLRALEGSMNIVHIRAVRTWRFGRAISRVNREARKHVVHDDPENWRRERDARLLRSGRHKNDAELALTRREFGEAAGMLVRSADECIALAYLPGNETGRGQDLIIGAQCYVRAAEAAREAGMVVPKAKYYSRAIQAYRQAGDRLDEGLLKKAIEAFAELDQHYRARDVVNIDGLIKTWHQAGNICLVGARVVPGKRNCYFRQATEYRLRTVKAIMAKRGPSYPDLRYAEELLWALKSAYVRLGIDDDEIQARFERELQEAQNRMKSASGGTSGAPAATE